MNQFQNDERLSNINPLKLRLLDEISKKAMNSSLEELLPQIIMINNELKRRNLEFTSDESDLLIDILTQNMSDEDKRKLQLIRQMLQAN